MIVEKFVVAPLVGWIVTPVQIDMMPQHITVVATRACNEL